MLSLPKHLAWSGNHNRLTIQSLLHVRCFDFAQHDVFLASAVLRTMTYFTGTAAAALAKSPAFTMVSLL